MLQPLTPWLTSDNIIRSLSASVSPPFIFIRFLSRHFIAYLRPTVANGYNLAAVKLHETNQKKHTHTHIRLTALFQGLPGWAGTRKVKPIWILLKQETVSGSGISWAICKSAPRSRQITTPAPHRSVFYRPDALPVAQPTASKHYQLLLNALATKVLKSVVCASVRPFV